MINAENLIPRSGASYGDEPSLFSGERDGVLLRLFGLLPDYTDPRIEQIWRDLNRRPRRDLAEFCRGKGIEVLKQNGSMISCALDIATLLVAAERGLLSSNLDHLAGEES